MALQPLWILAAFFQFLNLYTVGRTPWMGDEPVARPLPTHRTAQTQTSMRRVGFEPTNPLFEWAKSSCLRPRGHCDRPLNPTSVRILHYFVDILSFYSSPLQELSNKSQ
jgi:hypothetical protein